jgi:hypothetical protein
MLHYSFTGYGFTFPYLEVLIENVQYRMGFAKWGKPSEVMLRIYQ